MGKIAIDGFEIYFAEKLWEMIPAIYRHEDGMSQNPGVLRSIVELIAEQAAVLRRSNDQLWDDQFIELCNDWAVPYMADLLGTRLVSALNKRARRTDVAKTIYYRRRKGTLRVMEELIRDITGWDGKVSENFRRLARSRHGLDPEPGNLGGLFTGTPPGGWADLRSLYGSELVNSAFDEFHHTPDMRRHHGQNGRYGIPKMAFHIYSLMINKVEGSTPFKIDDSNYGFDPSGRAVPLFMPDCRGENFDWDKDWHSALEWELSSPVSSRLLNHAVYQLDEQRIHELTGISDMVKLELKKFAGRRFKDEQSFVKALKSLDSGNILTGDPVYPQLIRKTLIKECGKNVILENAIRVSDSNGARKPEMIVAGDASNAVIAGIPPKSLVICPEHGRFTFLNADSPEHVLVTNHYGFSGRIGAGTYKRTVFDGPEPLSIISEGGEITGAIMKDNHLNLITNSLTYGPVPDKNGISRLILASSDGQRPYICLQGDWNIEGGTEEDESELYLEGLWIGSSAASRFVISGHFQCVVIRQCTIDPGGDTDFKNNDINPVPVLIEGNVDYLLIDSCITGPVTAGPDGHIGHLIIRDSIIQSIVDTKNALFLQDGLVSMEHVTVLGNIEIHRLYASETLVLGTAIVTDVQNGCFRFSAANCLSELPRNYEAFVYPANEPHSHWFISQKFGHPGYAHLSEAAPAEITRGGENSCEMGAFNSMIVAVKDDSLAKKIEEYMPFGLIPILLKEI
jgi:hypothetical protein